MLPIPVMLNVRIRQFIPIVEMRFQSSLDIGFWVGFALEVFEKGERAGGRPVSEEPREDMKPNMLYFALIFENMSKAVEFAKSLHNG